MMRPSSPLLLLAAAAAAAAGVAALSPSPMAAAPLFTCGGVGPGGASWALTVPTAATYSVSVGGQLWMPNGDTIVHVQGVWYSAVAGSLVAGGAGQTVTGTDPALGAFSGWQQGWVAGSTPVTTTIKCFASSSFLTFDLSFPEGATGVNGSFVPGPGGQISGAGDPVTQFPSFAADPADPAGSAFWASQAVNLRHAGIWTLWEFFGVGLDHLPGGIQMGPLYVLNGTFGPAGGPSHPTAAVFSPLTHFHMTPAGTVQDRGSASPGAVRTSYGLASTVIDVPAGYTTSVGVYISASGMTGATYEWGRYMRSLFNTTRLVGDVSPRTALTEKISFWSDNGAVYFQAWWDQHCNRNCTPSESAEAVFIALKESFSQPGREVPFGIYQFDTWFVYQSADLNRSWSLDMIDWTPRADLFPHGVPYLTQQAGGIPLLLYSWGYATPEHGNRMLNYTWENSLDFGGGTLEAQPVLDQVYAFYSELRDRFLAYNGTSFEEDNLNLMTNSYQSHITAVDGIERWWDGFARPWCESEIPVQICESNAADILQSLAYPCVTNSRDNIDDVPAQDDVNFLNRWHVGFDRLFLSALGVQPFFDNVWTMESQPGSTWAPAQEKYVELAFILSALSAGPVGVGDIINNTNRTLVMTSCMQDGRILKASTPSTYLDLVYLPQSTSPIANANLGRVFQTISYVPTSPGHRDAAGRLAGSIDAPTPAPYASLLAVDIPAPAVVVRPGDFYPSLSPSAVAERSAAWPHRTAQAPGVSGYVLAPWNPGFAAVAAACADGSPGSACVTPFDDAQPLSVLTGVPADNHTHNFAYQTLSPVYEACPGFGGVFGGYSLLGELGKIVRVSVVRFLWTQSTCGGANASTPIFDFAVAGAPGEVVDVALLTPSAAGGSASGVVRHVEIVVGPTGTASVTCEGDGSAGSPCIYV